MKFTRSRIKLVLRHKLTRLRVISSQLGVSNSASKLLKCSLFNWDKIFVRVYVQCYDTKSNIGEPLK